MVVSVLCSGWVNIAIFSNCESLECTRKLGRGIAAPSSITHVVSLIIHVVFLAHGLRVWKLKVALGGRYFST